MTVTLHGCNADNDGSGSATVSNTPPAGVKARSVSETTARLSENVQHSSKCNVETVDGQLFVSAKSSWSTSKTTHIAGWVIDEAAKSVPSDARIRMQTIDGRSAWEQKLIGGVDRPDVMKALGGQAGFLRSGFSVDLDLEGVIPGNYVLYLAFPTSQGEQICGGWTFVLTK